MKGKTKGFLVPALAPFFLFFVFKVQVNAQASDPTLLQTNRPTQLRVNETYGRLPLTFEANHGQTDARVKFLFRGMGYTLFLTSTEAVLALRTSGDHSAEAGIEQPSGNATEVRAEHTLAIRMQLVDANPNPELVGLDELPGKSNYFIGKDLKEWRANIPHYGKVLYHDVYPGVDLVCYGVQNQLEYDLIVAPGASPSAINLAFTGVDALNVDEQGNLLLRTAVGTVVQKRPLVYQEIADRRRFLAGGYVLRDHKTVGFSVSAYDRTKPLIIDPVLNYSTYLGIDGSGSVSAIATDSSGNIYIVGSTDSLSFPTTAGSFQTVFGGGSYDAFVTKLDPTVSGLGSLVYSTYLGGSGHDVGSGIALDASGNVYLAGTTISSNFPTTAGAFQPTGVSDAFVAKLNAAGSVLLYSTYLGGSGSDQGNDIAIDGAGTAYVTGRTTSLDFPTTVGSFQPTFGGGTEDAFLTRLNPAGLGAADLLYSTYLGGSAQRDEGAGIAVDGSGNAYVIGVTGSSDFPRTTGALQTGFAGGGNDVFVTKLNPAGMGAADLVYSTYLGSNGYDEGFDIAVDPDGNAYVTGLTFSQNFPTTANAFRTALSGNTDAFVSKINPTGSALLYSTYLGGSGDDFGFGIAVDAGRNAYTTGSTTSINFPTANAFQESCTLNYFGICETNAFVTKLNPTGTSLIYSSYLGGTGTDQSNDIAVDSIGNVYVAGWTQSVDFPTVNAFRPSFGGGFYDSFVAQIAESAAIAADLSITKSVSPDPVTVGNDITYTITVTNNGPDAAADVVVTDTLPSGVIFVSSSPSQGVCAGTNTVTCSLGTMLTGASEAIEIVVKTAATGQLANIASVSSNLPEPDVTNNSATATTTVDPLPNIEADLALIMTDSPDPVTVGDNLTYTISITNNGPDAANDVLLTDVLPGNVIFVSSSTSMGSCSGTSTVTCNIGTIASGSNATVTLVIAPITATVLNNTVSVTGSVADPNPDNNNAATSTIVNAAPTGTGANLIIDMSDSPDPVSARRNVTYSITIHNNGPDSATIVSLSGMFYQVHNSGYANYNLTLNSIISVQSSQGICSTWTLKRNHCEWPFGCWIVDEGLYVDCNLGPLVSGDSALVNIVLEAAPGGDKIIGNFSVTSDEPDPDGSDNRTEQETTVGDFAQSEDGNGGGGGGGGG